MSTRWFSVVSSVVVVLAASALFFWRSWPSVVDANLYGEDGLVFFQNIYDYGAGPATFIRFNGYLVVGIYLVLGSASAIVAVSGLPFASLAVVVAVLSCLSLGAIAALPYLLFRRRIGVLLALALTLALVFVPLPASDADIIGSVGNLKFAVIPLAVMLIIYRMGVMSSRWRVVVVDIALLLCVLTNILTVALLPVLLVPALAAVIARLRGRSATPVITFDRVSAVILIAVSGIYLLVDLALGIPKYPGYLDAPFQPVSTLALVHHSTTYAFLYPFSDEMSKWPILALLGSVTIWAAVGRRGRWEYFFGLWACAIATVGFVANRPGISWLMQYGPVPDQFFYGQIMVFTFVTLYLVAVRADDLRRSVRGAIATAIVVFVIAAAPFGTTFGSKAAELLAANGSFADNVTQQCADAAADQSTIDIKIIPLVQYVWTVPRPLACGE